MAKNAAQLKPVKQRITKKTEAEKKTITELLAFRLHNVANLVSRGAALRYKREFGVTLWEWRTIALLGAKSVLSLNELAKIAGLDKSQISRVVAALTERGIILREVDEKDGRGIRLSLTASGQLLYKGLIQASNERNTALLECMTEEERQVLGNVLRKIEVVARNYIEEEKRLSSGD